MSFPNGNHVGTVCDRRVRAAWLGALLIWASGCATTGRAEPMWTARDQADAFRTVERFGGRPPKQIRV